MKNASHVKLSFNTTLNRSRHNAQENSDCDGCKNWSLHFEIYTNARIKYNEHSEKTKNGK